MVPRIQPFVHLDCRRNLGRDTDALPGLRESPVLFNLELECLQGAGDFLAEQRFVAAVWAKALDGIGRGNS